MTGSESFIQLADDTNGETNSGPINVRIKVISDNDDNSGKSKFDKEQDKLD